MDREQFAETSSSGCWSGSLTVQSAGFQRLPFVFVESDVFSNFVPLHFNEDWIPRNAVHTVIRKVDGIYAGVVSVADNGELND